uniref:Ig-like domain-containing protein n=1 Tax=Cyprinus carpio TaxID=7962 RepID=A0A8C1V0U8_CYPCA
WYDVLFLKCDVTFTPDVMGHTLWFSGGHDVTLFCQYINGNTEDKILQMQWTWQNESSKYEIMVFSMDHGLSLHDTFLKDRVSFRKSSPPIYEASIIIKDVKMRDQGVYSCAYTTFPSGSHTGQTTLTVLEECKSKSFF